MSARVTPGQLAEALGLPPPTAEQAAVIAAPPGPALVVAGAGAGKTETMASRVVWMVANRLVTPDQVLGLTFTRKAAQQLTARIRTRLARLAGARLLRDLDPAGELRHTLADAEPEISTYHSYAGRLLREHGLLLPVEPAAALLTETQLWQLAHQVVRSWDGDLDTDRAPLTVTEAVLALSGQLAEHLVEPEQLAQAHTQLEKLVHTLPAGPRQRGGPTRELLAVLRAQRDRVALLPLVRQLHETLRRRGALDFGAQMSLAARLAAEHREVAVAERARFRLVLLDEYQDTGHAQRILLAALFGAGFAARGDEPRPPGTPVLTVTAVGDPMQSIYGWRGASAANLPRFTTDFPRGPADPAPVLPLLTSWRNPPEALELANMVVEPLRAAARSGGGVTVDALRAGPRAEPGTVALALETTVAGERRWIARQIAAEWARARQAQRPPPTSAVLIRRNADAAELAEQLRAQGLPVEIVGLGGLLTTPEVADIVATLRLIAEPSAGSAAVRILTGARWRLGVADLAALARRARELSIGHEPGREITDSASLAAALREVAPEPAERAGLADAIADPGPAPQYSPAGHRRITALGRELALLRERAGQPLTELVADVERTIGVGVETQARRASTGSGAGRAHLDAFAEVVAGYANDPGANLGGLLAFLTAAESVENGLEPGEVEVAPDRVQVLTVHAAKGLEWEVVAVPHMSHDVFPATRGGNTWLGALAELPTALRGDRATAHAPDGVPVLDLSDCADRSDLQRCLTAHKQALQRRRLDEDRRLFYVALTRTERVLLVSAHHWPESGDKPKGPSEFLLELHAAAERPGSAVEIACWAPAPEPGEPNPLAAAPDTAPWPGDPLGARRSAIEAGAALVHAALAELTDAADGPGAAGDSEGASGEIPGDDSDDDPDGWVADVDALLAEYRAGASTAAEVELPTQLAATALVEMRADPGRLAARLHRPLPYPPNPLARRGTAFHAWVQRWFGSDRLPGLDDLPGAADTAVAADADLARMQDMFLSSRWASGRPVEVEVPFETTLAGVVIRGRMDAVFAEPGGGWTVVDWKTGAEPRPGEESAVAVQLAVYRVAWARLLAARTGESEHHLLGRVGAAFHYVRTGRTVSPGRLPGPTELAALLTESTDPDAPDSGNQSRRRSGGVTAVSRDSPPPPG